MSDRKLNVNGVDIKQIIRKEYQKCALDPIYFIKRYCYIQEPVRGRILFDLFAYQEQSIFDFESHDYNIILKGRQIGISTAVACYGLWLMLFHKDKNVLVIATKQDTAKNMIIKVRYAYDNLPVWLQTPTIELNKLTIRFKNGSQIKASTAAEDSGRSEALSLLVLDEAAFIKNAREIWVAALPTLSTGGRAVLISTPNGVGNFFHKTYMDAITGVSAEGTTSEKAYRFHPIKLDWRCHPNRDQDWRDKMGAIQGEREARQEFDAEFIGSGNTVVDEFLIEEYKLTMMKEPVEKTGFDGNIWVWERPNYYKQYIISADVSRGDGTDFSTFHVIDTANVRQVAEYKGKIGTTEFGHMLIEWATIYNDALLIVERENVGWAVLQTIIDRGYKNLFYMSKDLQVVEVERNLTNRYNHEEKKLVPGFTTSLKTRPLIIAKLDMYMREKQFIVHSSRFLAELETFIWENGKAQAMEGYNDDLSMAAAIGLWIRDTAMKLQQEGMNLTKQAINSIQRTEHQGIYLPNSLNYDPYKMPTGNPMGDGGDDEDIRWLMG